MKKYISSSILLLAFLLISTFIFGQSVTISPENMQNENTIGTNIRLTSNSTDIGVFGRRFNGLPVSPKSVFVGDNLFSLSGGGWFGSGYNNQGSIRFTATENWSATNGGTKISFWTTPNGTVTQNERMTINENGNVGIGTNSPEANLHIFDNEIYPPFDYETTLLLKNHSIGLGGAAFAGLEIAVNRNLPIAYSHGDARIMNKYSATLEFGTNDITRMYINRDGNVLIKPYNRNSNGLTNDPTAKFQIYHNTLNDINKPHLLLETADVNSAGMIRMGQPSLSGRFFTQYFSIPSADPNQNYVSWDYLGTNAMLTLYGNGNATVPGYTKLGNEATAPKIKMKELPVFNSGAGFNTQSTPQAHGLTSSKIISVSVLLEWTPGYFAPVEYSPDVNLRYNYFITPTDIIIQNNATNCSYICGKPVKVLITYKE